MSRIWDSLVRAYPGAAVDAICALATGQKLDPKPPEHIVAVFHVVRDAAFAIARRAGGDVELVRVNALKPFDVIVWCPERLVVREVTNRGTHKDALIVRVFGHAPMQVPWDAEIVRVVP